MDKFQLFMRRVFEWLFMQRDIITIPQCFLRAREATSYPIIFAKIVYSGISILMVHGYIYLFEGFTEKVKVIINEVEIQEAPKKILCLIIVGWLLTSVRSWWRNRTARRLSLFDVEFLQQVQRWGKRSYCDLFPVYIINYPFLIIAIYFIIVKIFPLIFNKSLSTIQMYIFALILGYAIDGIWELYKSFPEIFRRR